MERLDASLDEGPLFDPVKAAGSLGVLALIALCCWAEVRLVWWAIDAMAEASK